MERPTSPLSAATVSISPAVGDDYASLVTAACCLLGETDCRFRIHGFGCSEWPVDVAYDLSVFMEQLPELLEGVRLRRRTEIDLYSQGIERTLEFVPRGELVEIHCLSRTDWMPNPSVEVPGGSALEAMLTGLAADFVASLTVIGSHMAGMKPFSSWASRAS
ncbi:hypothetical protein [Parafrankia sp. EUN1f]|uniref:hypothetical protein n=1 Tax=Parafrankia sp. EUN1f TaxID=102897 RepID=UPI0018DB0D21|nr:hypothetical protein [Parafrankia sp. EUN1f]